MTDGRQYCDRHRREEYKKYNRFKRDEFSKRFYNSPEWRLRKQKLAINPLCEHCESEGKVKPATVVDHIVPIRKGSAALEINNLQSLCKRCHDSKTAREDGRWGK